MLQFSDKHDEIVAHTLDGIKSYRAKQRYYIQIEYENGETLSLASNPRVVSFPVTHQVSPETIDYVIEMVKEHFNSKA